MEGEQFSLCWNNFSNNLRTGFSSLLKDEDLVDVTLAAEGRFVKAHKAVLSICSPYLKDIFRANPADHPIVILPDINYSALQNLLQFMYQGEVSVSQDEIPAFMKIAEALKVKGLTDGENKRNFERRESPTNENGIDDRNSPYLYGHLDKKLATHSKASVKKLIKPIESLRYTDSPKTVKLSPSLKSPASSSSPIPQPNKKLKSESPNVMLLNPKEEPRDEVEDNEYDEGLDMAGMLDTPLNEPGRSSESWVPDYKSFTDTSSPGTLQCVLGKRGNPRLIVDSHTFYKKSTYKGKSFWYCKLNRTHFKCPAVCWTLNGHIVKWPTNHTHAPMPEPFNPDEDMEVPIDRLQEVLLHYGW